MLPLFAWMNGPVADLGIGYLLYWPLAARWLVVTVAALATTLAIYHALVRPFPVMRAAFGLRAGSARGHVAAVAPLSTPSRS